MFEFDGPNKRVHICQDCIVGGVAQFTVNELWSRYIDWVAQGDNSKYQPAMRIIGGDAIGGGQYLGSYLFFRNDLGWRGVPPEVDGVTIIIDGAFYAQDPLQPVMENLPNQETSLVINRSSMVMGMETSGTVGPTANDIANAVLAKLNLTTIPVDLQKIKGQGISGSGTEIDPWGPA